MLYRQRLVHFNCALRTPWASAAWKLFFAAAHVTHVNVLIQQIILIHSKYKFKIIRGKNDGEWPRFDWILPRRRMCCVLHHFVNDDGAAAAKCDVRKQHWLRARKRNLFPLPQTMGAAESACTLDQCRRMAVESRKTIELIWLVSLWQKW